MSTYELDGHYAEFVDAIIASEGNFLATLLILDDDGLPQKVRTLAGEHCAKDYAKKLHRLTQASAQCVAENTTRKQSKVIQFRKSEAG